MAEHRAEPVYASHNNAWPGPTAPHLHAAIASPDRLLEEPAPDFPGSWLPRLGPNDRRASRAYAAFANPADPAVKIALIVAGLGLDGVDSQAAVAELPGAVDFAVSAHGDNLSALLQAVRAGGHEYLLSLPMEPAGYPTNDEGEHELLTSATPPENARNLEWALCRIEGYVGVTGASDGQLGERFRASPALMQTVLDELKRRGLFYLAPPATPELPAHTGVRAVSLVIDDDREARAIDDRLAQLEANARQLGSAIGLVGRPSPATLARVVAWAARLPAKGISLTPISALAQP